MLKKVFSSKQKDKHFLKYWYHIYNLSFSHIELIYLKIILPFLYHNKTTSMQFIFVAKMLVAKLS